MSETQIIWRNAVLYGIIIAAVILLVCYWQNWLGVKPLADSIGAWLSNTLGNLDFGSIGTLITENLDKVVALLAGVVGAIVSVWKIRDLTSQINEELKPAITKLNTEKENLTATVTGQAGEITRQTDELKMYANDKTAEALQGSLDSVKTEYKNYANVMEAKVASLEKQLQEEKERAVTPKKIDEMIDRIEKAKYK